ncbi:hypothetical protein AURANDRAFT_68183 [Aureococcus anophagefferens]|uniref:Nucleotide-diphospho-sugar transferase domain-containing protein n=1 Tax=Aureococcus anophagefferens TaxID=44056 RepID=F0YNS2_AURAN|nr:hypothetical protein AURANDRAFT_68183 [Aureococcus anophagefferens]EGB03243.1 hypothetical protein AURANDRAFT_68183 [Aureococcus anophagefferens]|eukprot:XP_009042068.1 hypothetical protein AURANDRAFT_68183 [Aureococcus anophagefferens]
MSEILWRTRNVAWYKATLLMRSIEVFPECDLIGFMDPDAMPMPGVSEIAEHLDVVDFYRNPERLLYPGGHSTSFKGNAGVNNLNNTLINLGFMLIKPTRTTYVILRLPYLGNYAHDQRVLNDLLVRYPSLQRHVQIASREDLFNTPRGELIRHFGTSGNKPLFRVSLHRRNITGIGTQLSVGQPIR